MQSIPMFDYESLPSPCYVVDKRLLQQNLELLRQVKQRTGAKILLAQKAFAIHALYPMIHEYLDGTTASGLFEAKLGFQEMGGETHIFSPAYNKNEFSEIVQICDHIIFNSISQWNSFGEIALTAKKSCGLRINPECSTQEHGIYDPCAPFSRLGITKNNFPEKLPLGIEGLHFHTMCEQNSDALKTTVEAVEKNFGKYLSGLKWLNFGGGHHITRPDYDVELLCKTIETIKDRYGLEVYLEPGEAVVLNTGFLVATIEDIVENGMKIAILDASAACHMPDVLEMPYRPEIIGAAVSGKKTYTYRFGANTCLAGDIIGDYSFDKPLNVGDRVIFCDMAHYTMVKNNMFNGINLPSIAVINMEGESRIIRTFGYENYKNRLS